MATVIFVRRCQTIEKPAGSKLNGFQVWDLFFLFNRVVSMLFLMMMLLLDVPLSKELVDRAYFRPWNRS